MDEPLYLLEEKPDSVFAEMVRQLGPAESARLHEACRSKQYWAKEEHGRILTDESQLCQSAAQNHNGRTPN